MSDSSTKPVKRNAIAVELEDLLDPYLPAEFELRVPDAWMVGLLKEGLWDSRGLRVPEHTRRLRMKVLEHIITVRADSDPDSWSALQ
jgi:hypothetical protein